MRFARLFPSWAGLWAKDSALLLLSQGLTVVATSLAAILIARNLEPADWGIFSAFLGLSFALAIFVEFGLATWLLRELSRMFAAQGDAAEPQAKALVAAAISSAVTVTAAIVVLGTAVSRIHGDPAALVLALSSLLLYGGLFASANIVESYLRARRRLRRVVAASVLEKHILVFLLIVSAATGTNVWEIGLAYVAAGLLRLSVLGWSVFGRTSPPLPTLVDVRAVWGKSLPFALTSGAITVVPMLDALVLLALSATAAGYFALGVRVLGPAVVIAATGATALYPFLARRVHWPGAIWCMSLGFGMCGGVLAAVGIAVAPSLVPAIFGSQYEDAVPAVQLMLVSLPFAYAANPLLAYGFSSGRERAVVVATTGVALAGTAAIVAGQLIWGVSGAAAGALMRTVLLLGAIACIAVIAARSPGRSGHLSVSPSREVPLG